MVDWSFDMELHVRVVNQKDIAGTRKKVDLHYANQGIVNVRAMVSRSMRSFQYSSK